MTEELRRVVAGVFQRKGREAMTRTEFKHGLSLDLGWFPPAGARTVLERALQTGMLSELGEELRPTFDLHTVEIPLGWRPGGTREERPEPFVDRAFRVVEGRMGRERFEQEVQAVIAGSGGLLLPSAAALIVVHRHGGHAPELLEEAARELTPPGEARAGSP